MNARIQLCFQASTNLLANSKDKKQHSRSKSSPLDIDWSVYTGADVARADGLHARCLQ